MHNLLFCKQSDIKADLRSAVKLVNTSPTEGEAASGNYRKGHLSLHGLSIAIENPKGSVRSGIDGSGKKWSTKFHHHYGYIKGTKGRDGDHLDVFIGPSPESELVTVINQVNTDGSFDEHKVMLGFIAEKEAKAAYLQNYESGWKGLGSAHTLSMQDFKKWLEQGDQRRKFVKSAHKEASVTTPLEPHQERIRQRMKEQDGIVAAHGMGSGKTLSSIQVMEDVRAANPNAVIKAIVPAALRTNIPKEIKKHTDGSLSPEIESHNIASRDGVGDSDLLVVDEAHRARNIGTKLKDSLRRAKAQKRLLLTGTPVYNNPADIAPLVNMAAGSHLLPESPSEFNHRYFKRERVYPKGVKGLIYRLTGGVPGESKKLIKREELRDALQTYVDYHSTEGDDGYPDLKPETIQVGMSPRQAEKYQYAMEQLPRHLRRIVKNDLPPSKRDASKLMAFLNGPRQMTGSVYGFDKNVDALSAAKESPKLQALMKDILENPDRKRVIYSNNVASTIGPLKALLESKGIDYSLYTGEEKPSDRNQSVKRFNQNIKALLTVPSEPAEDLINF